MSPNGHPWSPGDVECFRCCACHGKFVGQPGPSQRVIYTNATRTLARYAAPTPIAPILIPREQIPGGAVPTECPHCGSMYVSWSSYKWAPWPRLK